MADWRTGGLKENSRSHFCSTMSTSTTTKAQYPPAQKEFINSTRRAIDADPEFFSKHCWSAINPKGGTRSSLAKPVRHDSFYVKSIAAWVPCKIFGNGFKPSCPCCETCKFVDLGKSKWPGSPKLLFGVSTHRYLDTKMYYCRSCTKSFLGTHPESMKLDADQYLGFFNFYLTARCAIDDELFTLITAGFDIPTAKIHKQLEQMVTEKYLNDHMYYLHAVRAKKIKKERRIAVRGDNLQGTIDQHLVNMEQHNSSLSDLQKELSTLQKSLRDAKLKLENAVVASNNPIDFKRIIGIKAGNNYRNRPGDLNSIPGMGVQKLQKLIANGFASGKSVADYHGPIPRAWRKNTGPETFNRWRESFRLIFHQRNVAVEEFRSSVASFESMVQAKIVEQSELGEVDGRLADWRTGGDVNLETHIPSFAKMNDPEGYNARVLSIGRIKSIRQTDFRRRKPLQIAKMFNQTAASDVLSIDSSYKIAGKVKVYEGVGRCFQPYKCQTVIHDRNACTIYHKMCSGAESMDEIAEGLKAIRDRPGMNLPQNKVKVIYVDNPKTVQRKIKDIFPEVEVKVDAFHWMKLWNDIMADPKSESAAMFRSQMSRAVFQCSTEEWNAAEEKARAKLIRLKKLLPPHGKPTRRQTREYARTTIPEKDCLLDSVKAVIDNCMVKDLLIDLQRQSRDPGDTTPLPKRYFKSNKVVVDAVIQRQYETIRQNFLSDPEGIDLYRVNPVTGKLYNCRGTCSNENDNLHIDRLTGNHLGIQEADRLITTYFEISNDNKRFNRLGEQKDAFTYR